MGESDCPLATVAGPATMREQFNCSRTVGESYSPLATVIGPPTVREHFKLAVGGFTHPKIM